jgi:hypothetical protein
MNELQNKVIKITGVESKMINNSTLYTLISNEGGKDVKYNLWSKKKDGSDTAAYSAFQQLNVQVGSVVEVAFTAEPQSFVNEQGKSVNFERRTVMVIKPSSEDKIDSAPEQSSQPVTSDSYSKEYIDNIVSKVKELEERIGKLERNDLDKLFEEKGTPNTEADDIPVVSGDGIDIGDVPF